MTSVIEHCLQGDSFALNEETIRGLLEIAGDPARFGTLVAALDEQASAAGRGLAARTAALLKLLRALVDAVRERDPERLDPILRGAAAAVGRLTPEMLVGLIAAGSEKSGTEAGGGARDLVRAVVDRMTDDTIAGFVARNAMADATSQDRLVEAFHALVRSSERGERLLALAHKDAASSPLGSTAGFEETWERLAQKMLASYTDKPFVSEEYARELSSVRTRALDIEDTSDDPPERRSAWLGTVATSEVRRLDFALLLDLLRLEQDTRRWETLMRPVVALIEDLLLVGDFETAVDLVAAVAAHGRPESPLERRQAAMIAIDVLVSGPMMRHIVAHLATMDEVTFDRVKTMCVLLGEVLIRPLAEALSTEERGRTRERLTAILIGFGAIGRREVERLKSSPNPTVRRTAIYLLREFGGSEALPELTELLDDREPAVQREAVRAIINIGTEKAFAVLQQALADGTARSREAIMQSLLLLRDERATPLFAYILGHVDHRGELGAIYLRSIEALGELRDPGGVPALKEALYRGEWWARRRTAMLRGAAVTALVRINSPEAIAALEEAAASGPRGVRAAARGGLRGARNARATFR
jgi:HEAT repeat protein